MSADRYSDLLKVRCRPELVETVDRAAAAQFVRPSEYNGAPSLIASMPMECFPIGRKRSPRLNQISSNMRNDNPMRRCAENCLIVTGACSAYWPDSVKGFERGAIIGLPSHMMTENYLAACRAAPQRP